MAMIERVKQYNVYVLLVLILIIGSWLRFHNLGEISFSNDELSALTRTRFDSFHELVEKGIKVDGHPVLVQVMMWLTTRLFNDNVFTIRFPFAISGIISIFLIFLLAKRWFGSATALFSAAALATLQFPVLYSQTARPYTIGLMFTLAAAYFWTRLLFDEKKSRWNDVAYILSASACMYTHYFSLMMAGIIGISGLFFLKKNNFVHYLICNLIVLFLFIPHISIFKAQFAYEGIGSWLDPPKSDFLIRFIEYGFNNSNLVLFLFISVFFLSVIFFMRKSEWKKFHSLAILWYIVPFMIGYYYSVTKAPVLQFSTLIFSFPFILIFAFSFIRIEWLSEKLVALLVFILLALGTYSTIAQRKYYQKNHFGVFKELAEKAKEWELKFGKENTITTLSLVNPEYINYYFRKLNYQPSVALYTDDERGNYGNYSQMIDTCRSEYFIYGWTNAPHFYETLELIQEKFPEVAERDTFFNSEITLFKRGKSQAIDKIITTADFEANNWDNEAEKRNKDIAHSGSYSQKMDDKTEYSLTYKSPASALNLKPGEMLKAEVWFQSSDSIGDAALVVAFMDEGETVAWNGMQLKYFYNERNKWKRAVLWAPVPDVPYNEVSVYAWNINKKTFYIDDFKVTVTERNSLYREVPKELP